MEETIYALKIAKMNLLQFYEWKKRNFSPPSPQFIKEKVLLVHGLNNAVWIESGTYLGTTTKFLAKISPFVYSIEPEIKLFKNAEIKFKRIPNISLIYGTSEEKLSSLLPKVANRVNFWLDGHYSSGTTYKGSSDTPIIHELKIIEQKLSDFSELVIFVDDVRCFDPSNPTYATYPELNFLSSWAEKNKMHWTIENDIFIMKKVFKN